MAELGGTMQGGDAAIELGKRAPQHPDKVLVIIGRIVDGCTRMRGTEGTSVGSAISGGRQPTVKADKIPDEHELLERALDDRLHPDDRRNACSVLARLRVRSVAPALVTLLLDSEPTVVWAAARAIADIASRRATKPLIRVLQQSRLPESRNATIWTLGELRDRRARRVLFGVVLSRAECDVTRGYAAEALGMFGRDPKIRCELSRTLVHASAYLRLCIVCALGSTGDPRAIPLIAPLLSDRTVVEQDTIGNVAQAVIAALQKEPQRRNRKH